MCHPRPILPPPHHPPLSPPAPTPPPPATPRGSTNGEIKRGRSNGDILQFGSTLMEANEDVFQLVSTRIPNRRMAHLPFAPHRGRLSTKTPTVYPKFAPNPKQGGPGHPRSPLSQWIHPELAHALPFAPVDDSRWRELSHLLRRDPHITYKTNPLFIGPKSVSELRPTNHPKFQSPLHRGANRTFGDPQNTTSSHHAGSPTGAEARPEFFDRHPQRFRQFAKRSSLGPRASLEQHRNRGLSNADLGCQLRLRELTFGHQPSQHRGKGSFGQIHLGPQLVVRRTKALVPVEHAPPLLFPP